MSVIPHIKLSDLTKKVSQVINQSFGSDFYWIIAEVSGHKFYPNQDRHYFDFVEKIENSNSETAKVKGIAWSSGSVAIKFFQKETGQQFTNGLQVLVKVKVEFNIIYGLQLILHDIDQSFTLGNLEKQRRETLLRLVNDNADFIKLIDEEYITTNKKTKLNFILQHIALIASPNSEGYADFVHTMNNNQFMYKFKIDNYFSSVQGIEAEREIVNTLISIYNAQKQYDCVVIIRGGGAKTDFLVFDSYSLARAVAKFPIPVITGIGHYKDVSIVDLMANTNTKTPTKSAEFIIAHNRAFEDAVMQFQKSIIIKTQQTLGNSRQRINFINTLIINKSRTLINHHNEELLNFHHQISLRPKMIIGNKIKDLENLKENLNGYSKKYLLSKDMALSHYVSLIKIMNPVNILKRGFALVSQKGKIIIDAKNIQPGSQLTITLSDVDINTTVNSKTNSNGSNFNL